MSDKILSLKKEDFLGVSETLLKQGSCIRFRTKGFSMSPFIRSGDIIKVCPVTDDITSGDILLYRSEANTAVVHRAVKKIKDNSKEIIITKGDSASDFDSPVSSEHVLGKVVAVERNKLQIRVLLGKILYKLQSLKSYGVLAKILIKQKNIVINQASAHAAENNTALRWVAKRGERVVGGVDLCPFPDGRKDRNSVAWVISSLLVNYRYRRAGIGERLVKEAIGYLNKIGADEVRLSVSPANTRAIRLYEKLGFTAAENNIHHPDFKGFICLKKNVKESAHADYADPPTLYGGSI